MARDFKTVEEYIAAQPDDAKQVLEQVRSAIRKAVPAAEETVSYNMPVYKLNGVRLLYFAGWKKHFSIYPAGKRLIDSFQGEIVNCKVAKSTLQFPIERPVPIELIERIARFRASEVLEREKG